MKTSNLAALGLIATAITLISYSYIQPAKADVCQSCSLEQKAQDFQNNQNIPEPHRS